MAKCLAHRLAARLRVVAMVALGLSPAACDTLGSVRDTFFGGSAAEGAQGHITGFLGGVVADEPRAALAAREVLASGGNAADAAVALGMMLTVTYPSRAGVGGGGACVVYAPAKDSVNAGVPEAVAFPPVASGAGGDRPSALPTLARGLFALHARYGRRPFETLIVPAEQAARFGVPASRAFVRDIAVVAGPLLADPGARAVFAGPGGAPLAEGDLMTQPSLGASIAQMRVAGVGDLYQGQLARRLVTASAASGGPIPPEALRAILPRVLPAQIAIAGNDRVAVPPAPVEGGTALIAALSGGTAEPGAIQPATTTFLTLDRDGNAVACALTMNNLFGTGRIAPGTGILLAAAPAPGAAAQLAPAIAWNVNLRAFRAAVGGSGQGAARAGAATMAALLRGAPATTETISRAAPEPGRANALACGRYLPDNDASCAWATDPRGAGLAIGSN